MYGIFTFYLSDFFFPVLQANKDMADRVLSLEEGPPLLKTKCIGKIDLKHMPEMFPARE